MFLLDAHSVLDHKCLYDHVVHFQTGITAVQDLTFQKIFKGLEYIDFITLKNFDQLLRKYKNYSH